MIEFPSCNFCRDDAQFIDLYGDLYCWECYAAEIIPAQVAFGYATDLGDLDDEELADALADIE